MQTPQRERVPPTLERDGAQRRAELPINSQILMENSARRREVQKKKKSNTIITALHSGDRKTCRAATCKTAADSDSLYESEINSWQLLNLISLCLQLTVLRGENRQ